MDDLELVERLVRIEAGLDSIKSSIEFGDKTSAQLVALLAAQVQRIEGDLTASSNQWREGLAMLNDRVTRHSGDISDLKLWRAKVVGLALGIGAASGGVAGAVARLVAG